MASSLQFFISKLVLKIKSFFASFPKQTAFDYLLFLSIFFCSGYAILTFADTSKKTIAIFLVCSLCFLRYFLYFDVEQAKRIASKQERPPFLITGLFVVLLALAAFASLFINHEMSSFFAYVVFGLLVLAAFFISQSFSLNRFVELFSRVLFVISCTSLFFYFSILLSQQSFGIGTIVTKNDAIYANYFYIFTQDIYSKRMQSIFWEPGLYSSFLLLASALEILFLPKINYFHLFVFALCIGLTRSTAGYLLFGLVLLLLLFKLYAKNRKNRLIIWIVLALFLAFIFAYKNEIIHFLAQISPLLFGKIERENMSFTTRVYSPLVDFLIFLKYPFFGAGLDKANALYAQSIQTEKFSALVDSQTSSSGFMLASLGIIGILYTALPIVAIFNNKRLSFSSKLIFSLLFFCILNKEPHTGIMFTWCIMFILISDSLDAPMLARHPKSIFPVPVYRVLSEKGDRGGLFQNLLGTFLLKGATFLLGFFSIPIYSVYFGQDDVYGIWLTLLSVLGWVMTFDLGFGNGMKNQLIKSFSQKDTSLAKRTIASTYIPSLLISAVLVILGVSVIPFLNLNSLFNISESLISRQTLNISFLICFISISIELSLKNIMTIFQALQKNATANLFNFFSSVFILAFAYFARFSDYSDKIIWISVAYSITSIAPYIVGTFIAFFGKLKDYRPSWRDFSWGTSKQIILLGLVYFGIQLALLFLNSTDQFLITSLYAPSSVVMYTKLSKLFNVIVSVFTTISVSFWSFLYKALVEKQYRWISKMKKYSLILSAVFSFLCVLVFIFLQPILDVWLGAETLTVNWIPASLLLLYSILSIFVSSISAFSNGLQNLKPQIIVLSACAVAKLPLIYLYRLIFAPADWFFIIAINCFLYIIILLVTLFANEKRLKSLQREAIISHEN